MSPSNTRRRLQASESLFLAVRSNAVRRGSFPPLSHETHEYKVLLLDPTDSYTNGDTEFIDCGITFHKTIQRIAMTVNCRISWIKHASTETLYEVKQQAVLAIPRKDYLPDSWADPSHLLRINVMRFLPLS